MRALLVVNHRATTTSRRSRDVLLHALRSEADVEIAYTRRRGHGMALARAAATRGAGLVVALGGDGTVNEVVNGLMAVGASAADRPSLAVVPGGSTNVFARALGLPSDWAEATGVILEALRESRRRVIGLGRADERYFTFCAGLGVDAAVVRRVEQARLHGRPPTPARYLQAALGQLLLHPDRRRPSTQMEAPGTGSQQVATVIIQNTAPWTYLSHRPIDPNPDASFDLGLDVLGLRRFGIVTTVRTIGQILSRSAVVHNKDVVRWHNVQKLTLQAEYQQPFQLDGDYLGERHTIRFTAVPRALHVVC